MRGRAKRRYLKHWNHEWGDPVREGNPFWLGTRRNWTSVMGDRKLGWFRASSPFVASHAPLTRDALQSRYPQARRRPTASTTRSTRGTAPTDDGSIASSGLKSIGDPHARPVVPYRLADPAIQTRILIALLSDHVAEA